MQMKPIQNEILSGGNENAKRKQNCNRRNRNTNIKSPHGKLK